MHPVTRIFVSLLIVGLSLSTIAVAKVSNTEIVHEKTFQELQHELNKEKHRQKVLARFEVEGLKGITTNDISLVLIDYSYHFLNNSGKKQPFVTVECHIDISKFEQEAENLRAYLKSTGSRAPVNIELPDAERMVVGLLDDEKDEFITMASFPKSVKPIVAFAELRKSKPEYTILSLEPDKNCTDCEPINALNTAIIGFDEKTKAYFKVFETNTYRHVDESSDLDTRRGYIDKATISWSDWIDNRYRELIISTVRVPMIPDDHAKPAFQNKKEIYSWVNDKELALVERIVDGQITINRQGSLQSPPPDVILQDGELYELRGKTIGSKLTATDGKIDSFLLSPDKHYVVYSIITGYVEDTGDSEDAETEEFAVSNLVIMDLTQKNLIEIKPMSEHEPFLSTDRWVSKEELLFHDFDSIAIGSYYSYNTGSKTLRKIENYDEVERLRGN